MCESADNEMTVAKAGLAGKTFVIADVETTGLDPAVDRVVQFALVKFEGGLPRERLSARVNPERPVPAVSSAVHLLRERDLARCPTLAQYESAIRRFVSDAPVVAHNAQFDSKFLPMIAARWICSLRLARRLWPDAPRHTNMALRFHLNLDDEYDLSAIRPHDAESDALVSGYLFLKELHVLQRDYELTSLHNVAELCDKPVPITHIHFGKFYGKRIEEVPDWYIKWILAEGERPAGARNPRLDDDTLAAVNDEWTFRIFQNFAETA